ALIREHGAAVGVADESTPNEGAERGGPAGRSGAVGGQVNEGAPLCVGEMIHVSSFRYSALGRLSTESNGQRARKRPRERFPGPVGRLEPTAVDHHHVGLVLPEEQGENLPLVDGV